MESTEEIRNEDTIGVDVIDPVGVSDVEIIDSKDGNSGSTESTIPNAEKATGKVVSLVFDIIAQIRNKDYWKLDTSEEKSVNKICPSILPKFLVNHSGIIGCIVTLLTIILKRIKFERNDNIEEEPESNSEQPLTGLTGGRTT